MPGPEAFRYEQLHGLTEQFVPAVVEQLFRLGVHQHDLAFGIDHHHPVRRGLHRLAQSLLGAFAVAGYKLVVGLSQLLPDPQSFRNVAVSLEHVGTFSLSDQHHAALHADPPAVPGCVLQLTLPVTFSLQDADECVHVPWTFRMQECVAHLPQGFGARETVESLSAAVPEGDRPVPIPCQHRVVGLVDQHGLVPLGLGTDLGPPLRRLHQPTEKGNAEARTKVEKHAHPLIEALDGKSATWR